jgi:hypothetical protein
MKDSDEETREGALSAPLAKSLFVLTIRREELLEWEPRDH